MYSVLVISYIQSEQSHMDNKYLMRLIRHVLYFCVRQCSILQYHKTCFIVIFVANRPKKSFKDASI